MSDKRNTDRRNDIYQILRLASSFARQWYTDHRLTLPKGVYSLRYFLSPMCIPNLVMHIFLPDPFVVCSCIYASLLQLVLNAYTRQNAYMHEQITKEFGIMNTCISRFGIRIGDRKYLNDYTPFGSVSLWDTLFHSLHKEYLLREQKSCPDYFWEGGKLLGFVECFLNI